jgi:hypothetical protein
VGSATSQFFTSDLLHLALVITGWLTWCLIYSRLHLQSLVYLLLTIIPTCACMCTYTHAVTNTLCSNCLCLFWSIHLECLSMSNQYKIYPSFQVTSSPTGSMKHDPEFLVI